MSAFIITRIHVGDYDTWRPMFDQDRPRAILVEHRPPRVVVANVDSGDDERRHRLAPLGRGRDRSNGSGLEGVSQLSQGSGRIEAADPESRRASSVHP